ncbi:CS1 type fimbrial major subunit [Edwardsiella tarda]|nr:CS1 type fimbrial major subunit [Edwardsiella tarda]AKH90241.1 CS1 type fimbrial major subunit [Edwardsiella tarda]
MKLKYAVLSSLVAFPFFAAAAGSGTATINVTADVNSAVAMVSESNGSLTDIPLSFVPGQGLQAGTEMVRLASNDTQHGVDVSLANAMQLTNAADASTVPMTITLAGKTLSTTKTSYAKTLFTNGETSPMQLAVKPTGDTKTLTAGHYSGIINLVLAQSTI